MIMSMLMHIMILVLDERWISGLLLLKTWVNLDRVLSSWLIYLLVLCNRVSIGCISCRINSALRSHSRLHLILNWVRSSIGLRWSSLDITILHSSLSTYSYFIKSFESICWWNHSLRNVHSLSLWIPELIFGSKSITLLVRVAILTIPDDAEI